MATKTKSPKAAKPAPATKIAKLNTAVQKVEATVHVKPSKLILSEKFRGRTSLLDDDTQIVMADSLRTEGQKQPLQVRAIDGTDTYEVIFGNTRKLGGDLIELGYKSGQKEYPGDPAFMLRCEIVQADDKEAFVSNVVENAHRNQCSPIDNARNQQKLREKEEDGGHGLSDNAIARLYGYNGSAYVNRLKKLMALPEFVQQAIHIRQMSASAGFILADADDISKAEEEEGGAYEAMWALVKGDGDEDETSVGRMQIVAAMKEWRAARKEAAKGEKSEKDGDGDGDDEGNGEKSVILSRSAFRKLIEEIGGDERCPDKTGELCVAILDSIDGKIGAQGLTNRMLKLLGETLLPKPEKTPEEKGEKGTGAVGGRSANNEKSKEEKAKPKAKK